MCYHQFFTWLDDARGLGPRGLRFDGAPGLPSAQYAGQQAAARPADDGGAGAHGRHVPRRADERADV